MTEREKMLAGQLYDCSDKELISMWHKAKNLTKKYNNLESEDLEKKMSFYMNYWGLEVRIFG